MLYLDTSAHHSFFISPLPSHPSSPQLFILCLDHLILAVVIRLLSSVQFHDCSALPFLSSSQLGGLILDPSFSFPSSDIILRRSVHLVWTWFTSAELISTLNVHHNRSFMTFYYYSSIWYWYACSYHYTYTNMYCIYSGTTACHENNGLQFVCKYLRKQLLFTIKFKFILVLRHPDFYLTPKYLVAVQPLSKLFTMAQVILEIHTHGNGNPFC